jgi:hypothetical protein
MSPSRMTLALGAVLILVGAAIPAAQADSSLFGAVCFPVGDLADATTAGWGVGGFLTTQVAPRVDLGGFVAYTDFVVDTTQPGGGAQYGPTLGAWEFQGLGQFALAPAWKAFLGLGVANYAGRDERGDSQRRTEFAWQLGAAYQLRPFEGRLAYHQIATDGGLTGWIAVSAGILF